MFLYPPIGLSLDNPLVILTTSEQSNFSLFCINMQSSRKLSGLKIVASKLWGWINEIQKLACYR